MYIPRLLKAPRSSFFLFGCRGTGKSTWIGHAFPRAHVITLLDEGRYQRYLAAPELFAAELRSLKPGSWVVVDEIQRLPALLNEVHRAMEERRLRFVLCGSSARKLRRAGVNLLGGRAQQRLMFGFLPQELGAQYDVERAVRYGTLPVVWTSPDPAGQAQAYAQLYLKEEIQAEALVRNLQGFVRFLPIAAVSHGQVINVANIARDAGVARTTVEGYLEILEDTLVAFRLPGFEARLRVKERRHPKLYFVDPGIVASVLRQHGALVSSGEVRGPLFEGLVASCLRAMMHYRSDFGDRLSYWAPAEAATTEVDFVLQRGRESLAIEVKSGRVPRADWFRGLRAIQGLAGLTRRIVVYPSGARLSTEDGIEALPFEAFAAAIGANRLWP